MAEQDTPPPLSQEMKIPYSSGRNQKRVKSILLFIIPDDTPQVFTMLQMQITWAQSKPRFGGNKESKKMQKNVLKHQFENFTTASNESLDKAYDRFQKLISQLEVHGAPISKEDINQKFLRSLPPSWNQIALIMRNKPDIDEIDIDDLYNNLRVYEDEMKRSLSSTSTSQNLAFLSSENTSSTNEVSIASGDFRVVLLEELVNHIDEDDLEELDLRWQVAIQKLSATTVTENGTLLGNADLERIIRKPLELLHMDLFGHVSVESINKKREFSVARTPQQNGVAERKNKTLIEAARTMLADSLLPIPFWAEAVNTACYVLNRVLVIKPQNKIPYELLIGKSPSISFMRPFGCPLTILNTLDSLGKFDGKSDEDQPNVAGTGPNWMFDLDFLTNSMNYIPVSVENQVNVDAGTQDSYVAGSSGKDKEPSQEYILLPLHPHRTRIPVEDVTPAAHKKPSESSSKVNDVQDSEDRNIASQKRAAQTTSFNKLSTGRSSVSTATTPYFSAISTPTGANDGESSFVYLGGKIPIDVSTLPNADLPIDPTMPDLEDDSDAFSNDGIFNGAYDDDTVGVVADFNNMDATINVSPIPILRIHKDHPKDQILGDPKLAVQTRGKIQKDSLAQQALVSYISKQNRTNHKDHQNCLLACFLSQEEPKNISQALQDESWVEAMQEELLQFKLQKVWILVDLPSGKKAIGTKWVFKNKMMRGRLSASGNFCLLIILGIYCLQMDVKVHFSMSLIERRCYVLQPPGVVESYSSKQVYKDKYVADIHKKFDFWSIRTATTPIESNKPLVKDEDGEDVDVHVYKSMIGSLMYLIASRPDIMFVVCGKKPAKSKPTVHKDTAFDDLDDIVDDAIDYMETKDAQDEGRISSKTLELSLSRDTMVVEEKESAEKGVSTEDPVSTAEPKVGNSDESATPTVTSTPTLTVFGDDETIAQVLITMSQNKVKQKEKEKGVEIKDIEDTDRPRTTTKRSILILNPLPKIDPKRRIN
ncbi:putative ribonuclease H-like domain-containing protein [Tanacetum coccineum]